MVIRGKTTDEMRAILKEKGITTNNVTQAQLKMLHKILSIKLKNSGLIEGTYRMNELSADDPKYMTCTAYYFEEREAVSFNEDGFIGVAGWADKEKIAPLIEGILEWSKMMALEASPCEWNPEEDRPARGGDPWHSEAEIAVGAKGRSEGVNTPLIGKP